MKLNRNLVITIVTLVAIATVIYSVATATYRLGKVKTDVYLIPKDTALTLNGTTVSGGTAYLVPGTYDIVAKKDGFATYSDTITVSEPSTAIDIALLPESDEAQKWAASNSREYESYEARNGKANVNDAEGIIADNPIIEKLPRKTLLYSIGYIADVTDQSGQSIIITIYAGEGHRQAAIDEIRNWGFNPAELNIEFKEYTNPFAS